jgi:hypothetical protein
VPVVNKKPKVELERITPELAARLLEGNHHNRNLRKGRVRQLADAIGRGEWELNGQTIKISQDDLLIDGQHRLQAVVESGIPIESLVIRGLPPEAQDTVDTGRKRRLADILRIEGYHDTYVLAAVVNILHRYRNGFRIDYSQVNAPSSKQALELIESVPDIAESVRAARRVNKAIGGPIGIIGALHCVFYEIDPEPTEDFFAGLVEGDQQKGDPLQRFRNQLIRPRKDRGYMQSPATVAGLMIKAFNLRRAGRRVDLLTFRRNEKLPEVDPPAPAKRKKR